MRHDGDGDGGAGLSYGDGGELLERHGIRMGDDDFLALMQGVDARGDGRVAWREFAEHISRVVERDGRHDSDPLYAPSDARERAHDLALIGSIDMIEQHHLI